MGEHGGDLAKFDETTVVGVSVVGCELVRVASVRVPAGESAVICAEGAATALSEIAEVEWASHCTSAELTGFGMCVPCCILVTSRGRTRSWVGVMRG